MCIRDRVHGATAPTVPIAAAAQQRRAFTGGLTLAQGHSHDFRRVDVHQTRVHNDHGLALLVAEATKTISRPAATTAADIRILSVCLLYTSDAADEEDRV